MARAYDRARTRDFVPSCDKDLPPDQQTSFQIGWLSVFDFAGIAEKFAEGDDAKNAFPRLIEIVRRSLRGWKNFPLPNGTMAPFVVDTEGLPTRETLAMIGPREIMEIAASADQAEELTPAEAGKS